MQDVAADRNRQPLDAALVAANGQRIEQRLSWVLVRAVAGVDDRAIDLAGEQMHRARLGMADDDNVRPHGIERDGGVDQRFALLHARRLHRHVHHVGAEPLAGKLEGGLRPGGGFEEEIDERAPAQGRALLLDLAGNLDRALRAVQKNQNVLGGKSLDTEQMPVPEFLDGPRIGH